MVKEVECRNCHEVKPHRARGLCDACYLREYREKNPPVRISELKREMEYIREDSIDAAVNAMDSLLEKLGASCIYRDGTIYLDIQGQSYKVVVE